MNRTSIGNFMATVWIACEGMMSKPVPGSRPCLPNNPTILLKLVSATPIFSPNTVFRVVLVTVTVSVGMFTVLELAGVPRTTATTGNNNTQQDHRQNAGSHPDHG